MAGYRHAGIVLLCLLFAADVSAQILRTEALAAAFPGATIRQEQLFLTTDEQTRARDRSGVDTVPALVARYIATRDGRIVGAAYVDTHTVRSKRESLLVSLDGSGRVTRVDVTAFLEPAEYAPSGAWLAQYRDRVLGDDLAIDRAIRPMAGATLTARAVNTAVRRVLAIDQVLGAGDAR